MADRHPQLKQDMAEHIRAMLREREWTQEQLAKKAGIDKGTLSLRLRGVNEFKAGELLSIAKEFDVPLDALFPGNPELPGDQAQRRLWLDGDRTHLVHSAA